MKPIPVGSIIDNKVHGLSYRIKRKLGQGGFGVAYLAHELNNQGGERKDGETCLKFSLHSDEWHGEVYFANLLKDAGHVVRMNRAFPAEVRQGRSTRMAFVIDMEYVVDGTVRDHLDVSNQPWTEQQIAFRVRQMLKPLTALHGMGVSHRDVTPPNVFVGKQKVLKLGDFGITKAQLHPSGVHADVFNADFAPQDVGRWWSPADDVFQVGLLLASLAAGEEIYCDVGKVAVNQFTSNGPLRSIIKSAISVKAQRPRNAGELATLIASAEAHIKRSKA